MRIALLLSLMVIAGAHPALCGAAATDLEEEAAQHNDIDLSVNLDAGEQSGSASATVRIRASREVVWALITSCPETLTMVPGLSACEVLETAPDQSWQRIRHVMNYSWFVPTLTYQFRATYQRPQHVAIQLVEGDLRRLEGSWDLQREGDYTVAHYTLELAPGFWVPHWLVRTALRHDLPKMLRALRTRAEAQNTAPP